MKNILISAFFITISAALSAQGRLARTTAINLCCGKDSPYMQYSSMVNWEKAGKILLIPQRPGERRTSDTIYVPDKSIKIVAIDQSALKEYIKKPAGKINIDMELEISGFDFCKQQRYDGIEAAAIKGDSIYFSFETNGTGSPCYIVMGLLDQKKRKVTIRKRKLFIPKPVGAICNAGFESLTCLPQINKLFAVFEKSGPGSNAFLIDPALRSYKSIGFDTQIYFRVTDACHYKGDTLLAIRHNYRGDINKAEFSYYIGSHNLKAARAQMLGYNPYFTSYTGLIKIYPSPDGKSLDWKTVKHISLDNNNWEGILLFQKGVLMITDEPWPGKQTSFMYCEL